MRCASAARLLLLVVSVISVDGADYASYWHSPYRHNPYPGPDAYRASKAYRYADPNHYSSPRYSATAYRSGNPHHGSNGHRGTKMVHVKHAAVVKPTLLPSADPFYHVPKGLKHHPLGHILDQRDVDTLSGADNLRLTRQIKYVTTDAEGKRDATITTVFVPKRAMHPPRILALQMSEDAASLDCSNSYAFLAGWRINKFYGVPRVSMISTALEEGYYISAADHEGSKSAFCTVAEGRATLDGVRALLDSRDLIPDPAGHQIIFTGYSGGGHASASAAQQAATYGKGLNVVGAAMGGIPIDPKSVLTDLDGGMFSSFAAAGLAGFFNAYPELENSIKPSLTAKGFEAIHELRNHNCIASELWNYTFETILNYTSIQHPLETPIARKYLAINVIGKDDITGTRNVTITDFPMLVWHSTIDEVISYDKVQDWVNTQCANGASINFRTDHLSGHAFDQLTGESEAMEWIKQRFLGQNGRNKGCNYTDSLWFSTQTPPRKTKRSQVGPAPGSRAPARAYVGPEMSKILAGKAPPSSYAPPPTLGSSQQNQGGSPSPPLANQGPFITPQNNGARPIPNGSGPTPQGNTGASIAAGEPYPSPDVDSTMSTMDEDTSDTSPLDMSQLPVVEGSAPSSSLDSTTGDYSSQTSDTLPVDDSTLPTTQDTQIPSTSPLDTTSLADKNGANSTSTTSSKIQKQITPEDISTLKSTTTAADTSSTTASNTDADGKNPLDSAAVTTSGDDSDASASTSSSDPSTDMDDLSGLKDPSDDDSTLSTYWSVLTGMLPSFSDYIPGFSAKVTDGKEAIPDSLGSGGQLASDVNSSAARAFGSFLPKLNWHGIGFNLKVGDGA